MFLEKGSFKYGVKNCDSKEKYSPQIDSRATFMELVMMIYYTKRNTTHHLFKTEILLIQLTISFFYIDFIVIMCNSISREQCAKKKINGP